MDAQIVSKGEFARMIAVSPGRVSQMISSGMIGPDALVGEGRMARIRAALALSQIKSRRDIGQALGNGLGTRLEESATAHADFGQQAPADDEPRVLGTEDLIKLERLAMERRRNRQAEEDDARRRGELMETKQARAEMTRMATSMLQSFEGALPDFATALAAKFELPQRDLLHELRRSFVSYRAAAADREAKRAAGLPTHREAVVTKGEFTS
ncbi:hypothetical protein XM25_19875 [Devosia sp. H5989]|nr:hypothetical protein XM25_19875 [Devosia sp. H5989]